VYIIFHPKTGELDVYRLTERKYDRQLPDEHNRYWIEEIGLFLGLWQGKTAKMTACWLRWWDRNMLLWGSERIEQVETALEQAEIALDRERILNQQLVEKLRELGIDP
jgi:hypothetical protein